MRIFFPALVFLFMASPLVFAGSAHAVVCDTMVGDGSTDNRDILNACMQTAASEPEKTVRIPAASQSYKISSTFGNYLTVPEGVSIIGDDGTTLRATFRLSNHSKLINLDFEDTERAVILGEIGYSDGYITGAEVRDCSFGSTNWASVLAYRVNECIFMGNTFTNTGGTGSNLQILGGKRNLVADNKIYKGKTCIIFKYSHESNGGGYESKIWDNVVRNNLCDSTVSGVKNFEEGISFDLVGDIGLEVSTREYDTLSSAGGNQVTLTHAGWGGGDDPDYVGYDMVFLTGNLAGKAFEITGQSGDTFTLDRSVSGAGPGDGVVIGAMFRGNIVTGNTIKHYDDDSILLYGLAFENIIENNSITRGGIGILSLDNVRAPSDSVTKTGGRAPTGYNLVRNNRVGTDSSYCAGHDSQCRVKMQYWVPYKPNPYTPFQSFENAIVDNEIGNFIWANMQDYYRSGNTVNNLVGRSEVVNGAWHPFDDVTELGSSALDLANPIPTCPHGQITKPCLCGGEVYPTRYCCSGVWQDSSCSTYPVCSEGEITQTCLCAGAEYSSGYCCSDLWQGSSCSPEPPNTTNVSDCPVFYLDMDSLGCGSSCVVHGDPQLVAGHIGNALSFDGIDDYLDTGFMNQLPNWTVSVWVKGDVVPGVGDAGPVMKQENFILSWNHNSERFRNAIGLRVGDTWYPASFGDLDSDTWYHLAATYDGETLRSYKYGVLVTENADPSGDPYISDYPMTIAKHSVADYYFAGTIDEVAVWDRALSDSEVSGIYSSSQPISCNISVHRCDRSPQDGCIQMDEVIWYVDNWYLDSTTYPMGELMEALRLFYNPVNTC